jgi:hypothetical protein
MKPILRPIHFHGASAAKGLMGTLGIILEIPQFQLVSPHLWVTEPQHAEQLFIIRAMTSLNDPVLPGRPPVTFGMDQSQPGNQILKGTPPFRVGTESHCEFEGVVRPYEEKGGSKSNARWRTPATVTDLRSGWISEYLSRVRK